MNPIKRALVSVSDKTGIADFAKQLHDRGVKILSTGGTADLLRKSGVPVILISDYTGFPEMMDGRIKTLHPKVHGGILGRREVPAHMEAMATHGISPIDMVVINLYPFEATIAKPGCTFEEAIENIDIGGPAMVRSASKNHKDVTILVNPADYDQVLREMDENNGAVTASTRQRLSRDAFAMTSRYDATIAGYLSGQLEEETKFPDHFQPALQKVQDLRYGENPHQQAALYRDSHPLESDAVQAKQRQGKELSFNNFIDMNAAWELAMEFEDSAAIIIKHTNPCGAACGQDQTEVFIQARETDPVSAFGGVLGFNRPVTAETAAEIIKNFVEVIIAPGYEPKALEKFASRKNIRVMEMPKTQPPEKNRLDIKRIGGGVLIQDADDITLNPDQLKVPTKIQPDEKTLAELQFAWKVAKHVKSNAIVYARGQETVGVGAGQMSRVDSARLALEKANKEVAGCVMASDAFFPFRDSIDAAAKCGIRAIISPGGSIRDEEVIQAADEHQIAMVFTGIRHFKH
ncbi:MAG: bifunctional phosphoribosylaminoimidazolecarboxamide formyltransferase/IMP cyclohydrolase [Nitrospinaceae bacterium]|nr:bifunctional phosphoribosylaminoimidazolecarboxamide formyltransferase/IMP cyclohydrolase [Nitrospinaceae bacterium]NIR54244.1 bifunctional phosphoribosylaminoimidazolecarboxamide formyltransferase/IMP cyclohydrolase [Nitrospinaceae bacterium]NIS84661.1 bifunctional phosphoribosylaminoimidazolecarboxamide formyltransferase/IMP cyclohydrolase [Nitrospinaceae bacterium]NIT81456.1 bifunctional phosphoribosylaminoimidazolecarboxamide formyltransferase/IMP cyclohydrolase [Nitrospinaceae bacterium]